MSTTTQTATQADMARRWRPSALQIDAAEAMLGVVPEQSVYTGHILVNKRPGVWTTDVEIVHLDGVFATRAAMLDYLSRALSLHVGEFPAVSGYTVHAWGREWGVFEDEAVSR